MQGAQLCCHTEKMLLKMPLNTENLIACRLCGKTSTPVSKSLGFCVDCIRHEFEAIKTTIYRSHRAARARHRLPAEPPSSAKGIACHLCSNECRLTEEQRSYCGVRFNRENKFAGATSDGGNLSWYYDPLPTNCVADCVCPGGTGSGYPNFAYSPGPEYGYKNLAVFYHGCSFDCLFCQNWHHRIMATKNIRVSPDELAAAVDDRTACICYFGGDPSPQLPHALRTSKLARSKNSNRILRICWETNGSMHPSLLRQVIAISLESGGCIKFDLKAWSENVHIALCGTSNKRTLENFAIAAEHTDQRPTPPLIVASTLLIPGYIDKEEISNIAKFIASLSPDIPYTLLAFHPDFLMSDLPTTPPHQAKQCLEAALSAGLRRVHLGNLHLLGGNWQLD